MSQVGVFPGWQNIVRRTVRAPVNPLDVATVVSIFPLKVTDSKPTLQPGKWTIEAGTYENPAVLTIGPSSWWKEVDPEQPLLEIPVASIIVADSFVRDYCVGLLGVDMGSKMPGLFYVPGELTVQAVKDKYENLLHNANMKQRAWYTELIQLADVAWARTNGNPLTINEIMKMAAHSMGVEDRDWLKAYQAINMVRCFACGSMKNPQFPVCPSCRAIDQSHPQAKDIKFAV